jgi:hypothetical protein
MFDVIYGSLALVSLMLCVLFCFHRAGELLCSRQTWYWGVLALIPPSVVVLYLAWH